CNRVNRFNPFEPYIINREEPQCKYALNNVKFIKNLVRYKFGLYFLENILNLEKFFINFIRTIRESYTQMLLVSSNKHDKTLDYFEI
ncbi:hypothetical protein BpHYR1_043580, partial [Brachionus plicatilis]